MTFKNRKVFSMLRPFVFINTCWVKSSLFFMSDKTGLYLLTLKLKKRQKGTYMTQSVYMKK